MGARRSTKAKERVKRYRYQPDYAVPPGWTLAELLVIHGVTEHEFARRIAWPVRNVRRFLKGTLRITEDRAQQLESATGIARLMWLGLEHQYRIQCAKLRQQAR